MSAPAVLLALCALIPAAAAAVAVVQLRRPGTEAPAPSWTRGGRSEIGAPAPLGSELPENADGGRS